jgi:hypothetical protein
MGSRGWETKQRADSRVLVQEALARWLAEGAELKDLVNLAFDDFFERRHYLPVEE